MVNSMDNRAARFIDQQDKIILELKTMNTSCSLILSVVLSVLFLVINLCRKQYAKKLRGIKNSLSHMKRL